MVDRRPRKSTGPFGGGLARCRSRPESFDYLSEENAMKFMVIVKADKRSEAGVLPTAKELETMGAFNEQLIKAGILVDAGGLQAPSTGARVRFRRGTAQVTDGPFAETKEIIAGYWVLDVKSRAEAIEWAKRAPFNQMLPEGGEQVLEIRQFFDVSDFPDAPASVVEQERAFRK